MADLQSPELGLRVAKALNIVGRASVLRALDEILYPVIIVDDLRQSGSKKTLGAIGVRIPAGGAGTFGRFLLGNPAAGQTGGPSRVRARIRSISTRTSSLATIELRIGNSTFPTGSFGFALEGGSGNIWPQVKLRSGSDTPAVLGDGNLVALWPSNTTSPWTLMDGLEINEGGVVSIQVDLANVTFDVCCIWEEEPLP